MSNKKAVGKRAKTRHKLHRHGTKRTPNELLKEFAIGSVVQIVIDPANHDGMPFRRFHGLTGKVIARQGKAFLVELMHGNKQKTVLTTAAHLKELQTVKAKAK